MSVTQIANALGDWNLTLKNSTPMEILNRINYFGHVVITGGRLDPDDYGDNLFDVGRYTGVVRGRSFGEQNKRISGTSLAFWLGDEDGKGDTIETAIDFTNASFTDVVTALLPSSVHAGNIVNLSGLYTGEQVFQSRRQAIDYVFGFYNAEWRIRGKALFDAGLPSDLYVTTPKVAILRNRSGLEMDFRALPGTAKLDSDVKDFTTRLLLLQQGVDATTIVATADINPGLNPYKDLFGNTFKSTRIVVEQSTTDGNAPARAQLQLNRFTSPRDALALSSTQYDIPASVEAGDYVWVFDPDAKLTDPANVIYWEGEYITPLKLRIFQMSWPIVEKMGVAYRDDDGSWIDLTDYVIWENGDTQIVVGGYDRSLTGQGAITQDPGSRPTDSTTPNTPAFTLPFKGGSYQSEADGLTRAEIIIAWTQPLNDDGSVITDGGQYEIRYRTGQTSIYETTHFDMSFFRHNQLTGTQVNPIPANQGPWNYIQVPWGVEEFRIQELTPGIPYDVGIRAYDNGVPPHVSAWSSSVVVQTRPDTTAPSTPASPTVAASKVALQVISTIGKASGGTFNLESDLNHFKVHAAHDAAFLPVNSSLPSGGTLLGKMPANISMMKGQIPAVATFQVPTADQAWYIKIVAVDNFGNESTPSAAVQQTAELWDSAYISSLTVSKVIAGTILADWVQAAKMSTSATGTGNRVDIAYYGIEAYDTLNRKTFDLDSDTGNFTATGTFLVTDYNNPGDIITLSPSSFAGFGFSFPTVAFQDNAAAWPNPAYINAVGGFFGSGNALGLNSGPNAATSPQKQSTLILGTDAFSLRYNTLSPTPNQLTGGDVYGDNNAVNVNYWDPTTHAIVSDFYADPTVARLDFWSPSTGIITRIFADANYAQLCWFNATTLQNWVTADSNGVGFGHLGGETARVTHGTGGHYFTAIRYCSNGESAAQMQVSGGSAGDTFQMRNAGGTDPVLDMAGFSARFVKNFVIDHPLDPNRWLVHTCTETPVAGLEYSGRVIIKNYMADVFLPSYFEAIADEMGRQTFVTVQLPDNGRLYPFIPRAIASRVKDGHFIISSDGLDGTEIEWRVYAKRKDILEIPVEPLKSEWERGGTPPYTYIVEK